MKEIEPYNQADQLFLQCELLQQFASTACDERTLKKRERLLKLTEEQRARRLERRRLEKEKRKLAQKIMVQRLRLMEEELQEMKTVDHTLGKVKHEFKNLMSQMFAERFSLNIQNKRNQQ